MLSDTRFQMPLTVASSAGTTYFAVPYRCVLRDVRAVPQAAMTSAASAGVTVTTGSTSLGSVAYTVDSSSAAAVGVAGTYTPNTSTGSTVMAAGSVVKFAVASSAASASLVLDIELDPHARTL